MLPKTNINRLLENTARSDVHGYNIYTAGKSHIVSANEAHYPIRQWDAPSLGLHGLAAIGHQLNKTDLIVPHISQNGVTQAFEPLRNHWTPAYMDTYYRSLPNGEYQKSGLLSVHETKCFTADDAFIAHLTLHNDGREPMNLSLSLAVPFEAVTDGQYTVDAAIVPQCLKKALTLKGYAAAFTDAGPTMQFTLPANGTRVIRYGFVFSPNSATECTARLTAALALPDPFADAEHRFNQWMQHHAPALVTENTDMLKVYYYRLFVIKCAIHTPHDVLPDSDFTGPCVYESPFGDWFGGPVGLPVPLQIEEMKWLKNADVLRSQLANWCKAHGTVQGYIQFTPAAVWHLYQHTGDKRMISDCYTAVKAYTLKKCAENPDALPVTTGSWVTGAEYQPSFYQYTVPKWDWRCDNEGIKNGFRRTELYRVDECAMHAANLRACERMAALLNCTDDACLFRTAADQVTQQLLDRFWHPEKQFFFDIDVKSGRQCDEAYCYDGFFPMIWALADRTYNGAFAHLADENRFACDFSLTSVSKSNPMYWFDNCIVGPTAASLQNPHRYGCCWNGPVWPFAVSLVLDALGNAAQDDPSLTILWNRLFDAYTELHFYNGDRSVPCICEHYRPTDGMSFSPITEYFHSEWISLFFAHRLGIHVTESGVTFAPAVDEEFSVDGITINGKTYCFTQERINGKLEQRIEVR